MSIISDIAREACSNYWQEGWQQGWMQGREVGFEAGLLVAGIALIGGYLIGKREVKQ